MRVRDEQGEKRVWNISRSRGTAREKKKGETIVTYLLYILSANDYKNVLTINSWMKKKVNYKWNSKRFIIIKLKMFIKERISFKLEQIHNLKMKYKRKCS